MPDSRGSQLEFTRQAEDDLIGIWLYIAEDDQNAATRILHTINDKCRFLADHPQLGPARPDIAQNLRYFVVKRYLILYREIPSGVEVVRVLHGARDLTAIFQPG